MNHLYILFVIWIIIFSACESSQNSKTSFDDKDTLKIGYIDTVLIGEMIFPKSLDSNKLSELKEVDVLLIFKSGDYCYVFFNESKSDFLFNSYWDKLAAEYYSFLESDSISSPHLIRVDYSEGPFLSGLYSKNDSIITFTADLRKANSRSLDKLRVRYFSTQDTIIEIYDKINVGSSLETAISNLKVPIIDEKYHSSGDVNIVLMNATSLIDNAWYLELNSNCCPDYTTAINLSFKKNKLRQIQYLDYEYIQYLFQKEKVTTKDIHLH